MQGRVQSLFSVNTNFISKITLFYARAYRSVFDRDIPVKLASLSGLHSATLFGLNSWDICLRPQQHDRTRCRHLKPPRHASRARDGDRSPGRLSVVTGRSLYHTATSDCLLGQAVLTNGITGQCFSFVLYRVCQASLPRRKPARQAIGL